MESFQGLWFDHENVVSHTSTEQLSCEQNCSTWLTFTNDKITKLNIDELLNEENEVKLAREKHVTYLYSGLYTLNSGYVSLDASRPWIIYWVTHALTLLGETIPSYHTTRIIATLSAIQNSSLSTKQMLPSIDNTSDKCTSGGFGGGQYQISHCAPNYAAVLALISIGGRDALQVIDRKAMYKFFMSVKHIDGGFQMHIDGEVDTRGTYTVIAIARILDILTAELIAGVAEYILSCQTYEGGFGGEPFNEAHGGYNFCALATLFILNQHHRCNLKRQEQWLLQRQTRLEGGFQGRTNKLVDSCYSFWQGGALAIIHMIRTRGHDLSDVEATAASLNSDHAGVEIEVASDGPRIHVARDESGELSFNQKALQQYVLHCAQEFDRGGLKDKPGKSRDYYHSCYALSGLSVAQHAGSTSAIQVYGDYGNALARTSNVYNVEVSKLSAAITYFRMEHAVMTHEQLLS